MDKPRFRNRPAAAGGRRALGSTIEAAARDYLLRAGLREVATNANYRVGELDLVMLDDSGCDDVASVVFVEVRYRRDSRFGGGAASIDVHKRRRIVRAAQVFLSAHPRLAHLPCRFDVIEAEGDPAAPRFGWLRDAFRADDC